MPMGNHRPVMVPHRAYHPAVQLVFQHRLREGRSAGLALCHVDKLALATVLTRPQRRHDRHEGVCRGGRIHVRDVFLYLGLTRVPQQALHAVERREGRAVREQVGPRSVLPGGGQRGLHDSRVDRVYALGIQPELSHRSRRKVVEEHIARRHQAVQDIAPTCGGQIDGHRQTVPEQTVVRYCGGGVV
jgi:hypothetical protein